MNKLDAIMDFSKQPLPPVFKRQGKECYLDPIRDKLIYITPEETVRQRVLAYLINELHVPKDMILVEEHLSHYNIDSKRRVDIVINAPLNETELVALAVIECKAPDIGLGEDVEKQLDDYIQLLGCDYAVMTNGYDSFCYHYSDEDENYRRIASLPTYDDMIKGKYVLLDPIEQPPRIAFEDISDLMRENPFCYDREISGDTKHELACVSLNLLACLMDDNYQLPNKYYEYFSLIQDYGVRFLSYGNAGGGNFYGAYRSFLINFKGSTEFVSIGFSSYARAEAKNYKSKTAINVAIDNEKDSHHALQLSVDDNVVCNDKDVIFYHSGRIAVGNKGSGKVKDLQEFVAKRYPKIISGTKFNLGKLTYNRNWNLDDDEVVNFIENLITYALIRDEYRSVVKFKR